MPRRVTIVTAGHLSTCPRMLKAADALHDDGYDVRVISVRHTPWATAADARLQQSRAWRWDAFDIARDSAPASWLLNGGRFRAAQMLASMLGPSRSYALAVRAFSRVHDGLVSRIIEEPADLIYGGTTGALAAVAEAGRRSGTRFAVDFEDFHCAEKDDSPDGRLANELAGMVMRDVAHDAAFITAGSRAIARACQHRYGVDALPVNNVFPLPGRSPDFDGSAVDVPRFYWFSQTIDAGRGLEDIVRAAGRLSRPGELHVRGVSRNGYVDGLRALAAQVAPQLAVHIHAPSDPTTIVDGCRSYSIGLALEPAVVVNNALALSNKALTYPLAGLPVILTRTAGHEPLVADLGEGAVAYKPGDIDALADGMTRWLDHPRAFARAREASWDAARRRWHWQHVEERGALVGAVEQALR